MREIFLKMILVFLAVTVALVTFGQPVWSSGEKYELSFASEYPDRHPTARNGFIPWIKKVKELSGGRLAINFFNPNTICPTKEAYESTVVGAVDLTASPTQYLPGKFPLTQLVSLPFLFNGAEAGSITTWELYKKLPEWRNEYKEVKVLWAWGSALFELHTTDKEVRTLDDLQGMKILSWTPKIRKLIEALGAHPVDCKPHDSYMSLQRGMANAVMCPIAPMRAFKIADVAKHHTMLNLMLEPFYVAMNWEKWNSLPPDLKKILEETTGDKMARRCGITLDEGSIRDAEWMKEQGHTFYVLPPAEKKKWQEKVKSISDIYIKDLQAKGHQNAQEIYDTAVRLGREYSEKTVGGFKK